MGADRCGDVDHLVEYPTRLDDWSRAQSSYPVVNRLIVELEDLREHCCTDAGTQQTADRRSVQPGTKIT
jgi:hypothetical protein